MAASLRASGIRSREPSQPALPEADSESTVRFDISTSALPAADTGLANLDDHSEEGISLFPMFNILACTLGVMVFVLATVATVSLGADKAVEFVAPDFPEALEREVPTWVEWDGSEMILHPSGERVRFARDLRSIPTFDATYEYMFDQLAGTRLGAALAAVATERGRYVILFVRPSGFRTLTEVRGYLDFLGTEPVEVPIEQDWQRIQVR